jgi:hypothetical protein
MGYSCPNCSAENEENARFCRKCGARLYPEDVHEASTRNLDPQTAGSDPAQGRTTGRVDGAQTAPRPAGYGPSPNYVPPPGPMASPYPAGMPMPPKRRNWAMILLAVFAGIVLLCGVGGMVIHSIVRNAAEKIEASKGRPITIEGDDGDKVIVQNPLGGEVSPDALPEDLQEWWYPGAVISQFVSDSQGGRNHRVLIMSTQDDVREVVEHYREVIGEGAEINEVTANGHEVGSLKKDDATVAITRNGPRAANTQIVVDLGGPGWGAHGPVPPVPPAGVPSPPARRPGSVPPGAVPPPPAPPAPPE